MKTQKFSYISKVFSIKKVFSFLIGILPSAFWILLIFGFDLPYIAFLTVICAVIHEIGHIVAIYRITGRYKIKSRINGFRLSAERHLSYSEEMIIALFGPLANLLVFAALIPFYKMGGEYITTFGMLNLFTALSNLIPIENYDGYRIAECLLLSASDSPLPPRILKAVSFTLIVILTFLSLYFIKSFDGGYWIFFIFIAVLTKSIKNDKNIFSREKTRKNEFSRDFKSFSC